MIATMRRGQRQDLNPMQAFLSKQRGG